MTEFDHMKNLGHFCSSVKRNQALTRKYSQRHSGYALPPLPPHLREPAAPHMTFETLAICMLGCAVVWAVAITLAVWALT